MEQSSAQPLNFWQDTRRTLALAVPMIIGQVSEVFLGITDTYMVGKLGVEPLAGVGFADNLLIVILLIGLGLCSGIPVLVSQSLGRKDFHAMSSYLKHGVIISSFFGLLTAIFITQNMWIFDHFKQPDEVVDQARPYIFYTVWSLLPALIFRCFRSFSEAQGKVWIPFAVVFSSIVLNIFFNWVFIFGNLGFEAMGTGGAGYGTLLARIIACLVLIVIVCKDKRLHYAIELKEWFRINKVRFNQLVKIGLPSAFQLLSQIGSYAMASIFIGWLGAESLAAHQICVKFTSFTFMIPLGITFAIVIRVGHATGRDDMQAIRRIGRNGILIAVAFMAVCGVIAWTCKEAYGALFIDNAEVIAVVAQIMSVLAVYQIFDGLQITTNGGLKGMADVTMPAIYTFIAFWLVGLPTSYWIGIHLGYGAGGVWVGSTVGIALCWAALGRRFYRLSHYEHVDVHHDPFIEMEDRAINKTDA